VHRIFDHRLNRERLILAPGDYWACSDDVVLYTVLGSCVSVCLKDPVAKIAGMNHFMLPLPTRNDARTATPFNSDSGRFGIHAMELLINKMLQLGAQKNRLSAKVFGGGHVLPRGANSDRVPVSNIPFALEYLKTESIPIIATDVGGFQGRKVVYFCVSGAVYIQKLKPTSSNTIIKSETKYRSKIQTTTAEASPVVLFDEES
jgi:chemotaxis protein CheD